MLVNQSTFNLKSTVTNDWGGSHRVVIDLEALDVAQDWKVEVSLADNYKINQIYGGKLTTKKGKTYISGNKWNSDLEVGKSAKIVLIVDEGNSSHYAPILPNILFADSPQTSASNIKNANITPELQVSDFVPSMPKGVGRGADIVALPEGDGRVIHVDSEFKGNLGKAIAAAEDGDVVRLGNRTYYTTGIKITKDITIDGQQGSVINGKNTSGSILELTNKADGATIQDVKIVNGSIGIYSHKAYDLTLQNLEIKNIGLKKTITSGQNNTGIALNGANGLQLITSDIYDIGRKGVGISGTDGAVVRGLRVHRVNLKAKHAQSHDAGGVKLFNTNDVLIADSYFTKINGHNIWNDTTNDTTIRGNAIKDAGKDFLAPKFNTNVSMTGIYNEKSSNSVIKDNEANSVGDFPAFKATEFSTETMTIKDNNFTSSMIDTKDYWVNESAEKLIATTEDPDAANFSLFADEYAAHADIS